MGVAVSAEVEEMGTVVSTQLLTVGGRVSGVSQGQIEVQILAGADDSLLHSQQGIVEAGSYRLTLMDLSTSAPASAKFSSQNKIRISYQQGSIQQSVGARLLTAAEIASGLVVQDFEIILAPQIEVASVLDFGRVYAGVVSQRQLLITNSGSAELQVSAISGLGLSAEPASFHLPAAESQSVLVSLTAEAVGSFSQTLLISNSDTDANVAVSAEVEELGAVVSTQLLTVGGRVSGLP